MLSHSRPVAEAPIERIFRKVMHRKMTKAQDDQSRTAIFLTQDPQASLAATRLLAHYRSGRSGCPCVWTRLIVGQARVERFGSEN